MMTLGQNKQKMLYSLQGGMTIPVCEVDEEGNTIYVEDSKGKLIPLSTGEQMTVYSEPTEFYACINNKLTEVVWQDYGIDNSTNYAQIITSKGYLPITEGSLIWKESQVAYKDEEHQLIDETSADYVVKGFAKEGLSEDLFLLKRNVK